MIQRSFTCGSVFVLFALLAGTPLAGQQNMGRLRVDATPTRAGIFVDGEYIGPARNHGTVRRYDLAAGTYTLTLRSSGHADLPVIVTINAGVTTEISPRLEALELAEPPFGTLRIKSPDKFAAVYVNGRFMGHADEFNNFTQGLLLNPGQHEVEIAPLNGAATTATVTIDANETTILGEEAPDRAGTYVGIFAGVVRTDNRIVDVDGFANWGNPGSVSDYDKGGFGGGMLLGKRFDIAGARLRIEVDGTFGDLSAKTNQLDPEGLDETARSEFRWIATGRGGGEQAIGSATVFATGGLALARVGNSVTDIDFSPDTGMQMDPDDSFRDRSTKLGWVAGAGFEAPLADDWKLRLEGAYLDFGRKTYYVNHSGNNSCGPGNPRRRCPYNVENALVIVRLAIIHRFGE